MTKDVLLSSRGLYTEGDEGEDSIETLAPGDFYEKQGVYYIFFEEIIDDNTGVTKSRIKYSDKSFELTRKGEVSVHLLFEEGKKTLNTYQMPFGNLVVGLDTKRIEMIETEEEIKISIDYAMEINYQQVSDNSIEVVIKSVKE